MPDTTSDVIVIGAGIAGLNAAKHACVHGLSVTNLESALFGGLVANVNELDGLTTPGAVSGYRMASRLRMELVKLGAANLAEAAQSLERHGDRLEVVTDKARHAARAVIVATGARLRGLDVPGESRLAGKGVSHCVDCDAPLHKGREVAIVGGGDSALQSAIVAARHCERVHLVHRRRAFRAKPHLVDRATSLTNVVLHLECVAEEVVGDDLVEGLRIRGVAGGDATEIACTGVFAYVGLAPNVEFLPAEITRSASGALVTDDALGTAWPGVFAAGAVRAGYAGMLTDAAAEGEVAAGRVRDLVAA